VARWLASVADSTNAVAEDSFRRSKNIKLIPITCRMMASDANKKHVMRVLSGFNTFFRRVKNLFDFNTLLTRYQQVVFIYKI